MLSEDELLQITRHALTEWPAPARLSAIVKGGSDRQYFRVHFEDATKPTMILMAYTLARPDNPRFVPATQRLRNLGVRVPTIFAHDAQNLLVWLEDLGEVDLHTTRNEPWDKRRPIYEDALRQVAKLHAFNTAALTESDLAEMELCFDEKLYEWEQNYFLGHYVHDMRQRDISRKSMNGAHDALRALRVHLASLPRGLVHRDFQSQNILIRNGAAWLIDYQGTRPGLAEYDLASLLLDPYVNLSADERNSLLAWYAKHTARDLAILSETYYLCAAQRLMQAIGAYANLSRNLGKPHFAQHIPVALTRLSNVCASHPMLKPLLGLISAT